MFGRLTAPQTIALTGSWSVFDRVDGASVTSTDLGQGHATEIPGEVSDTGRPFTFARAVTLGPENCREPQVMIFGGFSDGVPRTFINGTVVADEGDAPAGYKAQLLGLSKIQVPVRLLDCRPGNRNVIAVTVWAESPMKTVPAIAVVERRLFLGPARTLSPWFVRVFRVTQLFELGSVLLLIAIALLIAVVGWVEPERSARRLDGTLALTSLSIALYVASMAGLPVVAGSDRQWLTFALGIIGLSLVEAIEQVVFGRITRFRHVNRLICVGFAMSQLIWRDVNTYPYFLPYLFGLLLYGAGMGLVLMRRSRDPESMLLAGCVLAMVIAGVVDVLTDIQVFALPRLFSLSAVDMAIVSAIFVVTRFLRSAAENRELLDAQAIQQVRLRAALAEASEAGRLKSVFLANMTHELKAPLNAVINLPEGLLEDFHEGEALLCSACDALYEKGTAGIPESCPGCGTVGSLAPMDLVFFDGEGPLAVRALRGIRDAGRHLLALVSETLDFSGTSDPTRVRPTRTGLNRILEVVDTTMAAVARARPVELTVDRAPAHDDALDADEVKLTQVLMNLVSNAIKFSRPAGTVLVHVALTPDALRVDVVDNGIGIARADQDLLFVRYARVGEGASAATGTGLGLAISRDVIRAMGGDIEVASAPGTGSTFSVTMPRYATVAAERSHA